MTSKASAYKNAWINNVSVTVNTKIKITGKWKKIFKHANAT